MDPLIYFYDHHFYIYTKQNHKKRVTQWEKPKDFDNNSTTNKRLKNNNNDNIKDSQQVRVRHILLKHNQSRKPISWRNPEIKIESTKEDIHDQMLIILDSLIEAQSSNDKTTYIKYIYKYIYYISLYNMKYILFYALL